MINIKPSEEEYWDAVKAFHDNNPNVLADFVSWDEVKDYITYEDLERISR